MTPDITEENLQARSGKHFDGAVQQIWTSRAGDGNKSELSVGYSTLYGDMCGGLAVIGDVPKTMVYQMAHYINHAAGRK